MTLPAKATELEALLQRHIDILNALGTTETVFETVGAVLVENDVTVGMTAGQRIAVLEHGRFDLVVVTGGTVHYTAASGTKFRLRMDRASPMMLGAVGDGSADDTAALDLVMATDALEIDLQDRDYEYVGTFAPTKPIRNGRVIDDTQTHDYRAITRDMLATSAQVAASADVAKLVTLADVLDLLPIYADPTAWAFESTGLSWPAAGAVLAVAHGLPHVPKAYELVLVCQTATLGYAIGDEIIVPSMIYNTDSNTWDSGSYSYVYGHSVRVGPTNISLQAAANGAAFYGNGGVAIAVSSANFSLTVRAR